MEISTVLNTEEAKLNFLKGLIRVAKSDGINDKSEKEFYYLASEALGIGEKYNEELNQAWEDDEKIEVKFNTKEEKNLFFIQAVQLCWMDGEYTREEQIEMKRLAKEIGVREEVLDVIEQWVLEGVRWTKKCEELLFLS